MVRNALVLLTALLLLLGSPARGEEEDLTSALGLKYLLHVPSSYDAEEGAPLIVCLHGRGGRAAWELSMWRGQSRGAILAAPEAPNPGEWNFDKDLKPVIGLTLELKKKYRVTYTIVGGFSRGGYFSYYLGLRNPQVYDGIISFVASCLFDPPRTTAALNLPIFIANGDRDEMTPLKHAHSTQEKFRAAGYRKVRYFEMKGAGHEVTGEGWDECWKFVDEVIAPRFESARLLEAARRAADAKDLERAGALLTELLERYPESAVAAKARELQKKLTTPAPK